MGLTLHASVESFFRDVLGEALSEEQVEVSPTTEYYLVGLLGELTKARIPDDALALKLAEATDSGERVRALKEVGDTSLVLSGLFAESLDSGLVHVEYYMDLGEAAYRELAGRLPGSSVAEVYAELAAKFPRFVDVLIHVRRRVAVGGTDVVALYREYQRTRADWIERRLKQMGVIIGKGSGTVQ